MTPLPGIKGWWNYRSLTLGGDAVHELAVNTGTGNLHVGVTDYVFAARVPGLLLRSYNSAASGRGPGMLGAGWYMCWEEAVTPRGSGLINITYYDPTGAEYLFTNDGQDVWERPAGFFSELSWDSGTDELVLAAPDGFVRRYSAATGRLRSLYDANGNGLIFSWDGAELESIATDNGTMQTVLVNHFEYDGGLLVECGRQGGPGPELVFHYDYDGNDRLERVRDPENQVWEYGYDGSGRLELIRDPRGVAATEPYGTEIHYNGNGEVEALKDNLGEEIEFDYDGDETTITDRRGKDTVVLHDSTTFAPEQIKLPGLPPSEDTVYLEWSGALLLERVTDQLGRETDYEYDAAGNLLSVTQELDNEDLVTTYGYDAWNNLIYVRTPGQQGTEPQQQTSLWYGAEDEPARRNLLKLTRPLGDETHFTYSAQGDLLESVDPSGQISFAEYDAVYGVCTVEGARLPGTDRRLEELRTEYCYVAEAAWLDEALNPEGLRTQYCRDALGRVEAVKRLFSDGSRPADPITESFEYDECGNVVAATDANGAVTEYSYDELNRLAGLKLPETSTAFTCEYEYDGEGNLTKFTQHLNSTTAYVTDYTYDALGWLTQLELPAVAVRVDDAIEEQRPLYTFEYDAVGNLTARGEPVLTWDDDSTPALWHILTEYEYDELNRLTEETGPVYVDQPDPPDPLPPVQCLKYGYDADSRLTSLTGEPENVTPAPEPRTYSYAYDLNGRLLSVTDPGPDGAAPGGVTQYEYYANGQLQRVRLPRQAAADGPWSRTFVYDGAGRLAEQRDALGYSRRYSYLRDGRLAAAADAAGALTSYHYDGAGRIERVERPLGAYTRYVYAGTGDRLFAIEGPQSFATTYTFDARGRLTGLARIAEQEPAVKALFVSCEYDQLDRLAAVVDERDSRTEYSYDALGRLTQTLVDADHGAYTGFKYAYKYEYDLSGRLTRQENPDGGLQRYSYDAASRLLSMTNPAGLSTTQVWDEWGLLAQRKLPDGGEEHYSYDWLGRLLTQHNLFNETYEYAWDANGNNTRLKTPYGLYTWFEYNAREELVATVSSAHEQGRGKPGALIELFGYSPAGQLESYSGPQQEQWFFSYDALGRWTQSRNSLGQSSTRGYDANSCATFIRDLGGREYALEYDSLRRRTRTAQAQPAGGELLFDWGADPGPVQADVQQIVDGPRTASFEYDRLGRITRETQSATPPPALLGDPPPPLVTEYSYNWRGQVETRILPEYVDGFAETETYSYNLRGLLTGIHYSSTNSTAGLSWDALGRQSGMSFPGGLRRRLQYNGAGRLIADWWTDSAGRQQENYYGYDQAGHRVVQQRERLWPPGSQAPGILPEYLPAGANGAALLPTALLSSGELHATFNGQALAPNGASDYIVHWQDSGSGGQLLSAHRDFVMYTSLVAAYDSGTDKTTISGYVGGTILPAYLVDGEVSLRPYFNAGTLYEPQTVVQELGPGFEPGTLDSGTTTPTGPLTQELVLEERPCGEAAGLPGAAGPLLDDSRGRGGQLTQLALAGQLLSGPAAGLPRLSEPWTDLLSGTGPGELGRVAVVWDHEVPGWEQQQRYWNGANARSVDTVLGERDGRLAQAELTEGGAPEAQYGQWERDGFGRMLRSSRDGADWHVQRQDWLSGELSWLGPESGGGGTAWGHGPGLSRKLEYTEGSPPEMVESWLLRGPQGQVHAAADAAGEQKSGHGYTPWGANAYNWPPGILPEYIDGDLRVLPQEPAALPGWKDGAGVTADTLLLAPALDGQVSGGNGQGASGNPDTPPGIGGTQFIPGSPWDMTDPRGGDYAQGLERGGIRPPGTNRGGLPGLPSGKAPVGAPPLVQDSATIADQRLAGLWQRFGLSGSSEYYGVKPGQQRGASGWDDLRNPRLPLTAQRGAGSGSWLTGPPSAILPAFPENYLPYGKPQVPNEDSGGEKSGGTTDKRDDTRQAGVGTGQDIKDRNARLEEELAEDGDDEAAENAGRIRDDIAATNQRIREEGTPADVLTQRAGVVAQVLAGAIPGPFDDLILGAVFGPRVAKGVGKAIGGGQPPKAGQSLNTLGRNQLDNIVQNAGKGLAGRGLSSLKYGEKYGIQPYGKLYYAMNKARKAGEISADTEAHHLIPQSFAGRLGLKPNEMPAIAVTKAEHAAFTEAWYGQISRGKAWRGASRDDIAKAAKSVYAEYPDILDYLSTIGF